MAMMAAYHGAFHFAPRSATSTIPASRAAPTCRGTTRENGQQSPPLREPQRGFCPKAQGCAVPRATLGPGPPPPATPSGVVPSR